MPLSIDNPTLLSIVQSPRDELQRQRELRVVLSNVVLSLGALIRQQRQPQPIKGKAISRGWIDAAPKDARQLRATAASANDRTTPTERKQFNRSKARHARCESNGHDEGIKQ